MLDPTAPPPLQGGQPQPPMMQQPPSQAGGFSMPPGMPPIDPAMLALLPQPEPPPQKMYDCKIKRCIKSGQLQVDVLPPEDFLLDPCATRIDEEKMRFIGDRSRVTRSKLKLRYPKKTKVIDDLPAYTVGAEKGLEKTARDSDRWPSMSSVSDKASEEVEVIEVYVNVDYDGDGIAEWRQVVVGGIAGNRNILSNEEWGGLTPYSDCVPNPQPHRWRGRSLFDDLYDIQRIKTVLLRQTLDNLYLTNNPLIVSDHSRIQNPDVLTNRELGGNLNVKGDAATAVAVHAVPFIAKESLTVLEYFDMSAEKRTGVGRLSMALDPSVLQNQTATAAQIGQDIKHSKIESYARNIAEVGGLKRLFKCLLRLYVENQRAPFTIRLNKKWVKMDPRGWNADMDCEINVGLGSGSRDRDLAMLQNVAMKQEMVITQLGPYNEYCNIGHLFDTYRHIAEAAGFKSPELYFQDITQEQIDAVRQQQSQNPPPNPEMMKVQAQGQMKQMELQAHQSLEQMKLQANQAIEQHRMQSDAQRDAQKAQLDQQQMQSRAQIEQVQAQADIATQDRKTQSETVMAERKFELERQMAEQKFALDRQMMLEKHALEMEKIKADMMRSERDSQMRMEERAAQAAAKPAAESSNVPA